MRSTKRGPPRVAYSLPRRVPSCRRRRARNSIPLDLPADRSPHAARGSISASSWNFTNPWLEAVGRWDIGPTDPTEGLRPTRETRRAFATPWLANFLTRRGARPGLESWAVRVRACNGRSGLVGYSGADRQPAAGQVEIAPRIHRVALGGQGFRQGATSRYCGSRTRRSQRRARAASATPTFRLDPGGRHSRRTTSRRHKNVKSGEGSERRRKKVIRRRIDRGKKGSRRTAERPGVRRVRRTRGAHG